MRDPLQDEAALVLHRGDDGDPVGRKTRIKWRQHRMTRLYPVQKRAEGVFVLLAQQDQVSEGVARTIRAIVGHGDLRVAFRGFGRRDGRLRLRHCLAPLVRDGRAGDLKRRPLMRRGIGGEVIEKLGEPIGLAQLRDPRPVPCDGTVVEAGQFRIKREDLAQRLGLLQPGQDREVFLVVAVVEVPVLHPLVTRDMVGAAPVALDEKAFQRADGIVVQRDEVIAPAFRIRAPSVGQIAVGHLLARAVGPARHPVGRRLQRSVHPYGGKRRAPANDGLEPPVLVRLADAQRRGAGELRGHRPVVIGRHTGAAEKAPCHGNHVRVAGRGEEIGQCAGPCMDVDVLIDVHDNVCIGTRHFRMHPRQFQRDALRSLARRHRIVDARDETARGESVQDLAGRIVAIVRVDQEMRHPDAKVIGHPIQDERAFVLHRGHDDHVVQRSGYPGFGDGRRGPRNT